MVFIDRDERWTRSVSNIKLCNWTISQYERIEPSRFPDTVWSLLQTYNMKIVTMWSCRAESGCDDRSSDLRDRERKTWKRPGYKHTSGNAPSTCKRNRFGYRPTRSHWKGAHSAEGARSGAGSRGGEEPPATPLPSTSSRRSHRLGLRRRRRRPRPRAPLVPRACALRGVECAGEHAQCAPRALRLRTHLRGGAPAHKAPPPDAAQHTRSIDVRWPLPRRCPPGPPVARSPLPARPIARRCARSRPSPSLSCGATVDCLLSTLAVTHLSFRIFSVNATGMLSVL